jgi:hypothetical protein
MKRLQRIMVVVMLPILLSSCGNSKQRWLDSDTDKADAKKWFLEIADTVEKKDSEALKAMLSEEACAEAIDLDANVSAFINCFQGKLLEYEDKGTGSSESVHYGEIVRYWVSSTFRATTDTGVYWLIFSGNMIDAENPSTIGLHYLQIVSDEVKSMDGFRWPRDKGKGIYVIDAESISVTEEK